MLHHLELYASNLKVSERFWPPLPAQLGYRKRDFEGGFTLKTEAGPYLVFVEVDPEDAHRPCHRRAPGLNHIAFQAESRRQVDKLRAHRLTSEAVFFSTSATRSRQDGTIMRSSWRTLTA